MSFTFDYHQEGYDSFLGWMLISMVARQREMGDDEFFDKLKEASAGFSNVEMSITINGLEVNVPSFLDRLQDVLNYKAETAAQEKLQCIPVIDDLEQQIGELRDFFRTWKYKVARENNISLEQDN